MLRRGFPGNNGSGADSFKSIFRASTENVRNKDDSDSDSDVDVLEDFVWVRREKVIGRARNGIYSESSTT